MRLKAIALCLVMTAASGCTVATGARPRATVEVLRDDPGRVSWQDIATSPDAALIAKMPARWAAALAGVPARLRPTKADDRRLLEPSAAKPLPMLSPGSYRCRLVRLGGKPALASFGSDFCYVGAEGDKLSFTKQTGTSLPGGFVYSDGDNRLILLATNRTAGAASAPAYGVDQSRNLVGVIERIGPFRWRLAMPRGEGAQIDIYELTPSPDQPD